MAPKRKSGGGRGTPRGKKAKTGTPGTSKDAASPPDLTGKESYCAEIGIDMANGGSQAVFQWLCCSIIFGNRISEKTTIRAAKGLIESGLATPESLKESSLQEKITALNSEGKVQRGPSMSERLEETAKLVLEKYDGNLDKLREAAKSKAAAEKKLIKEFKGVGEMGLNIFCREAQLQWEELFPFADPASLKLAKAHGYPSKNAKELAEFVGNDRTKFVALLAALTKDELRGTDIINKAENDPSADDTVKDDEATEATQEAVETQTPEPKAEESKDEEVKEAKPEKETGANEEKDVTVEKQNEEEDKEGTETGTEAKDAEMKDPEEEVQTVNAEKDEGNDAEGEKAAEAVDTAININGEIDESTAGASNEAGDSASAVPKDEA